MSKTKAGAMLVLFTFLVYALVFPVLSAQRAWALPVKAGSRGAEVKETQTRLQALGFLKGKLDGLFGPKTLAAVKNFQKKWKLKIDGIVGSKTMAALRKSTSWISLTGKGNTGPPKGQTKPPAKPATGGGAKPPATKPPATGQTGSQTPGGNQSGGQPTEGNQSGSGASGSEQPDSKPPSTGQPDSKPDTGTQTGTQPPAANEPGDQPSGNQPDNNSGSQTNPPVSRGEDGGPAGIPEVPGKMVLGFTAEDYVGDKASYNSVVNFGQNVDAIATFTYFVDGKGNLNAQTPVPRDTIKMAKSKGTRTLALIHNYKNGFDKEIARSLLTSSTARQNLVNQLLTVLPKEGYDGINVDIEGIYPADSAAYIDLLKDLKAALKPKGYWITVSIPAKTFHNPKDGWSGGFDYKAIGELVDHALLMTYDQNWMGGTPGPIATLPWVEQVLKYAVSQMPAEKILMGLATYGYDWGAPRNRALAYPNAVALAKQYGAAVNWHQEYQVPYFKYKDAQGNQHEVWFEDQNSAKAKLQLVKKYGLAGVGIWRLGFEDSLYWDVMKEYLAN